jgi:hypothetical protein
MMAKPVVEYPIIHRVKSKNMEISKHVLDYYDENK